MKYISDVSVYDIEKRRFPDKHYEYVIRVKWSNDVVNVIYRRYSQFYELHSQLIDLFPVQGGVYRQTDRTLPYLPGKILFGRSHIRKVALDRLQPISDYCGGLIKLPHNISRCSLVIQFFETNSIDLLPRESVKKFQRESKKSIKSISQPITLEQYEVLQNYEKEEQSEISIKAGSVVDVIEKRETGWWYVQTGEGEGWVPSSYLHKVGSASEQENILELSESEKLKYMCTRSYVPQEVDEIQLDKGCQVEVLEKNLGGWWLVRYKGQTGRAPAIYLTRTDTLKAHRVHDFQQENDDAISDDFSGSSFDEFSSSDTSTENLNLSWEALNDKASQNHTRHQRNQENISKKPARPPPPVPGFRRDAPTGVTSEVPSHAQTPSEGVLGKISMFNKNNPLALRRPIQESHTVMAKMKPAQNLSQQNCLPSSAVKRPVFRDTEAIKPNHYPAIQPRPVDQEYKQADRPTTNIKTGQVGHQASTGSTQLPEFYNIRLKPVKDKASSVQATVSGASSNGRPVPPPKPKLS